MLRIKANNDNNDIWLQSDYKHCKDISQLEGFAHQKNMGLPLPPPGVNTMTR